MKLTSVKEEDLEETIQNIPLFQNSIAKIKQLDGIAALISNNL